MKDIKKGEISVNVFIGVVITIIGAAILIFLYSQLSWNGNVDSEACHESVIFRATLPSIFESYVPLKCKTEKVCITNGLLGGSCEDFAGIKGVSKVRVKSVQDVEKELASKIVDCWSMMGEGKISLFSEYLASNYGVGGIYPSCSICTRIAFDEKSLRDAKIDLSKMDLFRYMQTHAVPGTEVSYIDYLSGNESTQVAISDNIEFPQFREVVNPENNSVSYEVDENKSKISIDTLTQEEVAQEIETQKRNSSLQNKELAILFMQITSPKHGESVVNIIKGAAFGTAAAGVTLGPKNTFRLARSVGSLCTKGGWVGPAVCGVVLAVAAIYQQGSVAYNRAISASYCGDVSGGGEARDGCSVVRAVNYDAEDIKQYCSVIESIP